MAALTCRRHIAAQGVLGHPSQGIHLREVQESSCHWESTKFLSFSSFLLLSLAVTEKEVQQW